MLAIEAASRTLAPRGPEEWSGLAWLGLVLYVALFVLALRGITRLLSGERSGEREET